MAKKLRTFKHRKDGGFVGGNIAPPKARSKSCRWRAKLCPEVGRGTLQMRKIHGATLTFQVWKHNRAQL